ncbi:MAG: putative peptide maturation dehydrogenase [Lysobacter sp.]|nr:putative peptide maturation dehydrogenase [Lysobacter sp.]
MQIRRCGVLWMEPREVAHFDLGVLLAGNTGVVSAMQWYAHAPQRDAPLPVEAADVALLGSLSPSDWIEAAPLSELHGAERVQSLMQAGLIVGRGEAWTTQRELDERFRQQHWYGLAAQWHANSRWQGLDAAREVVEEGIDTSQGLRTRYGVPPPELIARVDAEQRLALPSPVTEQLDELLDRRSTCRNFDIAATLPKDVFAQMLARVFGKRGDVHAADDFEVLKKTSPSGGALHPTEAYLIVQRVEGVAPGLYHYHAGDHALEPLPSPDDLNAFARLAVAGQHWFSDAPVLVIMAPRFARNFWKYRNHAKTYRTVILDIGHLSQTLYLSATDLGLGAFITAAINEIDIERALGLTGFVDGPLAVCGFGARADAMTTSEFDPNRKVWPRNG